MFDVFISPAPFLPSVPWCGWSSMDPPATRVHNFTSGLGSTPAVLLNHSFFISRTCRQTFLSSLIWRRSSLAWHPSIPQLNLPSAPTPCRSLSCLITVPKGSFTAAGPDSVVLSSSSQSFFLYSFTCRHSALCRCACLLPIHARMSYVWEPAPDPIPREGSPAVHLLSS